MSAHPLSDALTRLVERSQRAEGRRTQPQPAVPFLAPELPPLEELFHDFQTIESNHVYSNGGPFERALAQRLSGWLGAKHALPVSNATAGLMIAMRAMARPIPHGKVVMPSFTFVASALSAQWAGLEPLFCDVDESSWQAVVPDVESLAARRDEIALILVCNTFGAPADVETWAKVAALLELPLLVDSAPGLGARYVDGRRQGGAGYTEVFSMHATKTFAVGEGGLITTDDDELAAKLHRLKNFGFDEERQCQEQGLNAKLSEMQAAIACRVLDGIEPVVAHRRARAAEYRERLASMGFRFQRDGECSTYQFVPAQVPDGIDPTQLQQTLAAAGIETRRYFAPTLHQHPHYVNAAKWPLPVTEQLSARMISLPMSNRISSETVSRICDHIER